MGITVSSLLTDCPVGTRLLASFYVLISGAPHALALSGVPASRFKTRFQNYFLCCALNVLSRRHALPVLLSSLYRPMTQTQDALVAMAELQMAVSYVPSKEVELGSLRYLVWLLLNSMGNNATFLLLVRLVARQLEGRSAEVHTNQGLWSLSMLRLTSLAMEQPNSRVSFMGIVEVPAKLYPLALALGLSILNGSIQWDTLAAIAYCHASRALQLERRLLPSRELADQIERRWPILPGILCGVLGGRWVPAAPARRRELPEPRPREAGFQLFGGRGHRLGD